MVYTMRKKDWVVVVPWVGAVTAGSFLFVWGITLPSKLHDAQRDAASCEDRFRSYKRQKQIQEDTDWCRDQAREHADVSYEGCMDRRAKEWPLP